MTKTKAASVLLLAATIACAACAQPKDAKAGAATRQPSPPNAPESAEAGSAPALIPLEAHPREILASDPASFRGKGFELYSWRRLPGILIFRFADTDVQDAYLKRIAFFVEKAGFRGRLARDEEIKGLHGWNAHDYRAADLGRFFKKADDEAFALNGSELELKDMLLSLGLLERSGEGIRGRAGKAIVSISVSSGKAMERRFLAHELYHGIYFTDPGFAAGAAELYAKLDPGVRDYVLEYFDYKEYDLSDADLVVNEFAAYFLQQPPADAPSYFATTVAGFLEADRGGKGEYRKRALALGKGFEETGKAYEALSLGLYGFPAGQAWK
jgi:hypothetical protein